jgi:hypothetical protein
MKPYTKPYVTPLHVDDPERDPRSNFFCLSDCFQMGKKVSEMDAPPHSICRVRRCNMCFRSSNDGGGEGITNLLSFAKKSEIRTTKLRFNSVEKRMAPRASQTRDLAAQLALSLSRLLRLIN